jgi:hypothetical protein
VDLSGRGEPTVAPHAVERQDQHLRVADNAASRTIATILRHDAKVTSYKLALIRAVNDVVLSFPDAGSHDRPIAIPLRVLAEYWLAYYWPFVDPRAPISQGPRSLRNGTLANDMAFRPALAALRQAWQEVVGETVRPSDGFFLINEFRVTRRREGYPLTLRRAFGLAVSNVARSIEQPIHYAGPGEWGVFSRPVAFAALADRAVAIPSTTAADRCVVVSRDLWDGFLDLSLWVEALSIHEWSLFTESVTQPGGVVVRRGDVYTLLTDRPDNRRPLDWERNQIDLLLMEGRVFECPWTGRPLRRPIDYDLDHLLPVSVYPINELWNLAPADRQFNQHVKRDRLPSHDLLLTAAPRLELAYQHYSTSGLLGTALRQDVAARFTRAGASPGPRDIATVVVDFLDRAAEARNLARFSVG